MAQRGRPLKFTSVEDTQSKIDAYFRDCDMNKRPYTVTGLAYALETSRQTLIDYQNKDEYFDAITRAKDKCELYSAELILKKEGSTKGVEFNLSNNHHWSDKTIVEQTNVNVDITTLSPEDRSARLAELKAKLAEE